MNRYKIIIVLILSLVYNINTNTYGHETFDIEIEEDVYYVPNNGNMIYITAHIVKEGEYEYADPEEWYWDDDGLDSYQDGGDEEDSTLELWSDGGEPGEYEITVNAESATGEPASDTCSVCVVGMGEVEIEYSTGNWDDVTNDSIVVLKGTKYDFRALPNPSGSWPDSGDYPVWMLNETTQIGDDGDTQVEVTFNSVGEQTLTATCGTSSKSVTITVVAPVPDHVSFLANVEGEEHTISGISDPVWTRVSNPDNPASYTKGKYLKLEAGFWASEELTYPTNVYIDASDNYYSTYSEDYSVTFGTSWSSETSTHSSDDTLPNVLCYDTLELTWGYKVPSGTNQWITMSSTSGGHQIYVVYDEPKGDAASNYTESNLSYAMDLVEEEGLSTEAEIASFLNDEVYDTVENDEGCICDSGFQVNFDAAMGYPPTSGDKGMCCCRAEGLNCVLQILGIGPYVHDYVNETNEPNPNGYNDDQYCAICGKQCYRDYRASQAMRWQGVIKAGGNGSTCYSPNAVGVGENERDEGTYAEFQATIESSYGFEWFYSPFGEYDVCEHLGEPNQPPE